MPTSIANYLAELNPLLVSPAQPIPDARFDQLARRLFAAQFELVPPYRNLCLARGISPGSIPHWMHIPAVPTAGFKEFDWTSLPPNERTRVFHSSGTTAKARSRHFHDATSLEVYERSLLAWAQSRLFPDAHRRLKLLFLTPPPAIAPHSSLVHMFDAFRREWGAAGSRFVGHCDAAGRWTVEHDPVVSTLTESQARAQPVALLGTAFSFVELLDRLQANQLRFALAPGSWILETGGYKGRSRALPGSELYRQFTHLLGVPTRSIMSEYGMCELSSQAYDHTAGTPEPDHGRSFLFPPWARAVVINPNANAPAAIGESGLLRVFDLANVRSVMAVQTEDLARVGPAGFALLGRAPAAAARGCSLLSR